MQTRRAFMSSLAALSAAPVIGSTTASAAGGDGTPATPANPAPPNRIGVSTYSFWGFDREELRAVPNCLRHAADMGFDGVEILERQLTDTSPDALNRLKREAFLLGLDLMGFSTHQGFVSPEKDKREENIKITTTSIERAARMGIPTMRVNTGRWGTSKDFDALMANKGIEPPLEGYTDEDGFPWVIEAYATLAKTAEHHGVLLGLENHWGLGISAAGVIRIIEAVNSPWLRATLDTGNFLVDHAPQVAALAPYAVLVQAKTYDGGGRWYTLEIDNQAVARTVRAAGFRGYVSLEFEGLESPLTAIPRNLAMLREAWR